MAELILAVDEHTIIEAEKTASIAIPHKGMIKLGLEFFCAQGAQGVAKMMANCQGVDLFLDLKLHDIPNTVAKSVAAVAPLKPRFLTIHSAGGLAMMHAAQTEAQLSGITLLAVTVLTSLDQNDLVAQNIQATAEKQVLTLAELALEAGLNHIVCSPLEIKILRQYYDRQTLKLVVPGIRPAGAEGDQKRVMTPIEAVEQGADFLVIGRPITRAENPSLAYSTILDSIKGHS